MTVTVHHPNIYNATGHTPGEVITHDEGQHVDVDDRGNLTVFTRGHRKIAGYAHTEWARYTIETTEDMRGENPPAKLVDMDALRAAELQRQGVVTE